MAHKKYERTFSQVSAPYLQGPYLKPCNDVDRLRKGIRQVQLARDCKNVELLSRVTSLEKIHFDYRKDWMKYLAKVPNLKYVELSFPKIEKIGSLKCLEQIRTLVLICNRHQTGLGFLRGMTNLRSLCVSEAIEVESLAPLSSLTQLQELYIDGSMHRRHKLRSLAPIGKLDDLRFAVLLVGSAQQKRPLRHLLRLSKLEYLFLARSYLDDPDDLDAVVDQLPKIDQIEFNGGLKWPKKK